MWGVGWEGQRKKGSRRSKDGLLILIADICGWNDVEGRWWSDGKICLEAEGVKGLDYYMTIVVMVFRGRDPAFSGIRPFQQHDVSIWSNAKSDLYIIIEPSCFMSVCSVHLSHLSRNLLEAFPLLISPDLCSLF